MTLATSPSTSASELMACVEDDLQILTENLKNLVTAQNPILAAAAEYLFGVGGKYVRPALVLMTARAVCLDTGLTQRHRRLAEITEMIHTASLVHDDVIDESGFRRGVETVHACFGARVAILAGDFLFAQSSWYLANLENLEVVKLLSRVIMDLAEGEVQQGLSRFSMDLTLDDYLQKSYLKTASLLANSCKAAGVLSNVSIATAENLYQYGRALGLAFQIVDDLLDFTGSTETLGKPAGSDLKSGNLTAPVLYALQEQPYLRTLIQREFSQSGDAETALNLVLESRGISRTRDLALKFRQDAISALASLPASDYRQSLLGMADYVVSRLY
jgi:all-trans-nonaprenyl-diphosphate synthase